MYAVIISGGKQYRVTEGQILRIEKLPTEVGDEVNFDQVLMVVNKEKIHIGAPYVAGGQVSASVVNQTRGDKIRIVKHRRRKHYHKEMGHRQYYTDVKITGIHVK